MAQILIVEDEEPVRRLLEAVLRRLGHGVHGVSTAAEALAHLGSGAPVDLVLSDVTMPGMDGWWLITQIRAAWPDLPIGVVTGGIDALRPSDRSEEVSFVLAKPVALSDLREAVTRALGSDGVEPA